MECLVECKYRYDGTKWIFIPREYGGFGSSFADLFVAMDQCCIDRKLDRSFVEKFEDKYPLCARGVELMPESVNPKSIEQAVQQLRYAVVSRAVDAIDLQLFWGVFEPTPMLVSVPSIITTAQLWRLKLGVTVEDVRACDEIDEVADLHDVLVLQQKPDNLNEKDTKARLAEAFNASQTKDLNDILKRTRSE